MAGGWPAPIRRHNDVITARLSRIGDNAVHLRRTFEQSQRLLKIRLQQEVYTVTKSVCGPDQRCDAQYVANPNAPVAGGAPLTVVVNWQAELKR
jgi:hypothetical protein